MPKPEPEVQLANLDKAIDVMGQPYAALVMALADYTESLKFPCNGEDLVSFIAKAAVTTGIAVRQRLNTIEGMTDDLKMAIMLEACKAFTQGINNVGIDMTDLDPEKVAQTEAKLGARAKK